MVTPASRAGSPAPASRSALPGTRLKLRSGIEVILQDILRNLKPPKINGNHRPSIELLKDLAEPDDFRNMIAWGRENLESIRTDLTSCQVGCTTYKNEIIFALNNVNNALAEIARAPRPAGGSALPPPLPPASLPAVAATPILPPPPPIEPRPRLAAELFGHETGGPAGPRTQMERQRVAAEAASGRPRFDEGPDLFRDAPSLDLDLDKVFDDPAVTAANAFTNKDRVAADLDAFDGGEFEPATSDEADTMAERLTALKSQVKGDRDLYIRVGQTISMLNLTSNNLV